MGAVLNKFCDAVGAVLNKFCDAVGAVLNNYGYINIPAANRMDEFYRAKEDDTQVYHRVCAGDSDEIDEHTNASVAAAPAGMARALSSLECKGETPSEWRKKRQEYVKKFTMAKKCLQRRLTTMKKYGATTSSEKTKRKEHIYPIQYAYAYGKGCLKKFASPAHQEAFKGSVNALIRTVSGTPSSANIKSYFSPSGVVDIDESIISGDNPSIRDILGAHVPYDTKERDRGTIHSQAEIAAAWAADATQIADKWDRAAIDAAALLHAQRPKMKKLAATKMEERVRQIRHDTTRLRAEATLARREAEALKLNAATKNNIRNLSGPQRRALTTLAQNRRAAASAPPAGMSGWGRKRQTRKAAHRSTRKN